MTKVTPKDAFLAVMCNNETPQVALEEPLISKPQKTQETSVPATSPFTCPSLLKRIKMMSFLTGSVVALVSQSVLSQTMWDESILTKSTTEVVTFSFMWSFWTCAMVFSSMLLLVNTVYQACADSSSNGTRSENKQSEGDEDDDEHWDNCVFQIEAHHIVGSLISISLAWVMIDVLKLNMPGQIVHNVLFLSLAVIAYGLFFWAMTASHCMSGKADENDEMSLMPTYQLVAATLGLIVGVCSQFILSLALWKDHMTKPLVENVVAFSLLWSLCTVMITFTGCVMLRSLTADEKDRLNAERIFLRMESHYVFCSLIGICLAWILMDLVLGMKEQIIPSLLMLAVSLVAFRAILYCFPEDKCLEELAESEEDDDEEQQAVKEVSYILAVE